MFSGKYHMMQLTPDSLQGYLTTLTKLLLFWEGERIGLTVCVCTCVFVWEFVLYVYVPRSEMLQRDGEGWATYYLWRWPGPLQEQTGQNRKRRDKHGTDEVQSSPNFKTMLS